MVYLRDSTVRSDVAGAWFTVKINDLLAIVPEFTFDLSRKLGHNFCSKIMSTNQNRDFFRFDRTREYDYTEVTVLMSMIG